MRGRPTTPAGSSHQPRLLNISQTVSAYGGTPRMWRRLIWNREIAFVQVGRKHFFDRHDLDEFVERSKRMA
jgi:excisionase family DNA binding protein